MRAGAQEEFIDTGTSRLLIKKTWCHGQLLASAQIIALGLLSLWGTIDAWQRAVLILTAIMIPIWGTVAWSAMQGRWRANGRRVILVMGCGVELMYVCVLVVAARDLATDRLANVMVFVATALQLVETGAFLLVVAYFGQFLEEFQHAGDLERILNEDAGAQEEEGEAEGEAGEGEEEGGEEVPV